MSRELFLIRNTQFVSSFYILFSPIFKRTRGRHLMLLEILSVNFHNLIYYFIQKCLRHINVGFSFRFCCKIHRTTIYIAHNKPHRSNLNVEIWWKNSFNRRNAIEAQKVQLSCSENVLFKSKWIVFAFVCISFFVLTPFLHCINANGN